MGVASLLNRWLFLALAVMLALCPPAMGSGRATVRIGILIDEVAPELEPLVDDLHEQIIAVVGQDATVEFPDDALLVSEYDAARAQANYDRLAGGLADLIIAFGPTNGRVISTMPSHPTPTILFGDLNADLVDLDGQRQTSGRENFTYLVSSHSYRGDLDEFRSLVPFRRLFVVVTEDAQRLPLTSVLDDYFAGTGIEYTVAPYRGVPAVATAMDAFDPDAVYVAEGFSLPTADVRSLAARFIERRLPSFTATRREHVEMGFLATRQTSENIERFFRRLALTVEGYINGTPLASMPVRYDDDEELTINFNTAALTGVSIPYRVIASASFVGEFVNALSEERYSLVDAMQAMLDRNLSLASRRRTVDLADVDVRSAVSNYLPDVAIAATGVHVEPELARVSGGQAPEWSTDGQVSLNQTIFSPDASLAIGSSRDLARAERASLSAAETRRDRRCVDRLLRRATKRSRTSASEIRTSRSRKRNLEVAELRFETGEAGTRRRSPVSKRDGTEPPRHRPSGVGAERSGGGRRSPCNS